MERINFKDGTLKTPGYATDNSGNHLPVTEAIYEGDTPLSGFMMNKLQDNIETHRYRLKTTTEVLAGGELTLPHKYKVGNNSLTVIYGSEILMKASINDDEGHYYEIGEDGSISNKIKLTSDWSLPAGEQLDLLIQGKYE